MFFENSKLRIALAENESLKILTLAELEFQSQGALKERVSTQLIFMKNEKLPLTFDFFI